MKTKIMANWPLVAFSLTVLLAGFNAIGVHFIVLELPPFWGGALRIAPAALIMFLLVFFMKLPLPRGRALLGATVFGALNFGASYALIYYGLQKVQPGLSVVILAIAPLFTLVFAIAHRQETFHWRALLGTLLAAGGIVLVFQQELQTAIPFFSLLALIIGTACIAEAGVIAKDFPRSHPITTNAIGMSAGAIILFLMSFLWREKHVLPTRTSTWVALIYLILLGTCAVFIMFLYILKRWPVSRTAYQFVLMPFVTIAASAWLTREALSPILLVGAALVLAGVLVGAFSRPRRQALGGRPVTDLDQAMSKIIK